MKKFALVVCALLVFATSAQAGTHHRRHHHPRHHHPHKMVPAPQVLVPHVISVEAQTISGGLAALIGTVIASNGLRCRLWPLAVTDSPDGLSGSQRDCWRRHGIDRNAIVSCALTALEGGAR